MTHVRYKTPDRTTWILKKSSCRADSAGEVTTSREKQQTILSNKRSSSKIKNPTLLRSCTTSSLRSLACGTRPPPRQIVPWLGRANVVWIESEGERVRQSYERTVAQNKRKDERLVDGLGCKTPNTPVHADGTLRFLRRRKGGISAKSDDRRVS